MTQTAATLRMSSRLMAAFPGAWVNAHTSAGVGVNPDTKEEQPYNTAGYALKQYGKDGAVQSIADSFAQYLSGEGEADPVTEPVSFLILPFLPGALGMAVARLFGLGALGCLYAGRLGNLLAYTLLCGPGDCAPPKRPARHSSASCCCPCPSIWDPL